MIQNGEVLLLGHYVSQRSYVSSIIFSRLTSQKNFKNIKIHIQIHFRRRAGETAQNSKQKLYIMLHT